jgi:hypothetical protein
LDRSYVPEKLDVQETPRYDFGSTRDLQPLFSETLIDIINDLNDKTLSATELRGSGGYFHLAVDDQVTFDTQRRKTRFGPLCDLCGQFRWVAGATPAYLVCGQAPLEGIFRTDMEFGDRNGRSTLLIVGKELKRRIEVCEFTGVHFHDAYRSKPS